MSSGGPGRYNPIPLSLTSGLLAMSFVLGIGGAAGEAPASGEIAQSVSVGTDGGEVGEGAQSSCVKGVHDREFLSYPRAELALAARVF